MNKTISCLLFAVAVLAGCTKDPEPQTGTGTLSAVIRSEGSDIEAHLPLCALRDATVLLLDGQREVASGKTDIAGNVVITDIPSGSYQVAVTHKDFPALTMNVSIRKNEVTTLKNYLFDCLFMPQYEKAKKKWTVIHFVNMADVQLEGTFLSDIRKIEKEGGSGNEVNHVVYMPATANNTLNSQLTYLLKPQFEIVDEKFYDDVVKSRLFSPAYYFDGYDYPDADPSDYKLLEKSVVDISALYPSDSVMLFIYDHGSGIDINVPDNAVKQQSISVNMHTNGEITMPQLRDALNNIRKQDIHINTLVLAACTMAQFEVAYELKDCGVNYMVVSEPTSNGLNYECEQWVEDLNDGAIAGFETARRIARASTSENVYAVYDMKYFAQLQPLFNDFAGKAAQTNAALLRPLVAQSLKQTAGGTPPELTYSCYDLADFAKNVSEASFEDATGVKVAAKKVYDFLNVVGPGNFVAELHNPWASYQRARGVAVMLRTPDHPYAGHNQTVYRMHSYYRDGNTAWDTFLSALDN